MLTACGASRRAPPPLAYSPAPPPAVAVEPCTRTPIKPSPDGTLTSAGAELALRERDMDLMQCEAKRRAAIEAWPD
jgi:hypothetical protein